MVGLPGAAAHRFSPPKAVMEDHWIAKRSHRPHGGVFGALRCESVIRVSGANAKPCQPDRARSGASAHIATDLAAAYSSSPSQSPLASVRMTRWSLLHPFVRVFTPFGSFR